MNLPASSSCGKIKGLYGPQVNPNQKAKRANNMTEGDWARSIYLRNFVVHCPECGSYSDDPATLFSLNNGFVPTPERDFILGEVLCHTCDISFDVARLVDPRNLEKILEEIGAAGSEKGGFNQNLLERYQTAVNDIATLKGPKERTEDGRIRENKGLAKIDVAFLNMEDNPDFKKRAPIISMDTLALARGVRLAITWFPDRVFCCTIGPFTLVLSLEQLGEVRPSYAMHVSICNRISRERLTNPQVNFLISLFFGLEDSDELYE
ncbi:MAG: hypothetical protein O6918_13205, partial [Deltaproteobacteria bacterium]|nr:hypothetical protein [Deltaproteobacteria bacterium]